MKTVLVIGSINLDNVLRVQNLPKRGETIIAKNYEIVEGGKGANQAAAIGKLGVKVSMFGKIGNDIYGEMLLKSLKDSNVNIENIIIDEKISTGKAFITVENSGENTIVIDKGANGKIRLEEIKRLENEIFSNDIIVTQMEIPIEIVFYVIKKARKLNKIIILNLSPAVKIPDKILNQIDFLILNELELEFLTNVIYSRNSLNDAIKKLRNFYKNKIVVTIGPDGAAYSLNDNQLKIIPTFDVIPIDETGAGDAFIGGFVFGLANDKNIDECIKLGNATGSLATTIIGAQKSLPHLSKLKNFLARNNVDLNQI